MFWVASRWLPISRSNSYQPPSLLLLGCRSGLSDHQVWWCQREPARFIWGLFLLGLPTLEWTKFSCLGLGKSKKMGKKGNICVAGIWKTDWTKGEACPVRWCHLFCRSCFNRDDSYTVCVGISLLKKLPSDDQFVSPFKQPNDISHRQQEFVVSWRNLSFTEKGHTVCLICCSYVVSSWRALSESRKASWVEKTWTESTETSLEISLLLFVVTGQQLSGWQSVLLPSVYLTSPFGGGLV